MSDHGTNGRRIVDEMKQRILSIADADACFSNAVMYCIATDTTDSGLKERLLAQIVEHEKVCHSLCAQRIRIEAEAAEDPLTRMLYRKVFNEFVRKWLQQNDNEYTVEQRPKGTSWHIRFAEDLNLPYTGIECFESAVPSRKRQIIYDVCSEEIFDNHGSFIQHLDETACRSVRWFPVDSNLHWRSIVGDEGKDWELLIRWNGRVKKIASDFTLHARYARLLRRRAAPDVYREEGDDPSRSKREGLGQEAITLRDIALKYDERAWFAGYLSRTLGFRRTDELRRGGRDPVRKADLLPTEDQGKKLPDTMRSESEEGTVLARDFLNRLSRQVGPLEKRILDLKAQGLGDADIGHELGIRRETVSRKFRKIKEAGQALKKS